MRLAILALATRLLVTLAGPDAGIKDAAAVAARDTARPVVPQQLFASRMDISTPLWHDLGRSEVTIVASSELCQGKRCYAAKFVLPATKNPHELPWCEGAAGAGVGEWIEFRFARPERVDGFFIAPFYDKSRDTMFGNARVKVMEVITDDGSFIVEFDDVAPEETFREDAQFATPPYWVFWTSPDRDLKVGSSRHPIKTRTVRFAIREVFPGSKHDDLCISQIDLGLTRNRYP